VENNGLKKGGSRETYELLHHVAGLEDVWQLHWSEKAGDRNFAAERIANPDESTAYWIKLTANEDGSFRVLNGRTGLWKSYPARSNKKRNQSVLGSGRHQTTSIQHIGDDHRSIIMAIEHTLGSSHDGDRVELQGTVVFYMEGEVEI
jgi:hypothetical protein